MDQDDNASQLYAYLLRALNQTNRDIESLVTHWATYDCDHNAAVMADTYRHIQERRENFQDNSSCIDPEPKVTPGRKISIMKRSKERGDVTP